jgi:hypothetical protein
MPEDVPVFPSRLTFWSQAVGAWETIDGNGNAVEAQRDFGGLFTGIDAHVGEASRIGIVGGYTQSQLSVDERLSSADVDSGHVGVYAATSLDGFNLRAGAAYAFHNLETSRAIVFPGLFETARPITTATPAKSSARSAMASRWVTSPPSPLPGSPGRIPAPTISPRPAASPRSTARTAAPTPPTRRSAPGSRPASCSMMAPR